MEPEDAENWAPEPDDLSRPVSLRMMSVFERLRRALPEPRGVVMALQGLGFALVPGPAEDTPRSVIAGVSMDSVLGVLASIEGPPDRIVVAVSSATGAEVDLEELHHLVTRVYDLGEAAPMAERAEVSEGWVWPVVLDGVPKLLSLARFEDGAHRLMAETDERIRAMAAQAVGQGGTA